MSQILTDGNDVAVQDKLQSTLYALDGDDSIDVQFGGTYAEYGGSGNDYFINNANAHLTVYGGDGNDAALGGLADDVFSGDNGNDVLIGDAFSFAYAAATGIIYPTTTGVTVFDSDYLYGGAGIDGLYGLNGNDFLFGGDGGDTNAALGNTSVLPNANGGTLALVKGGLYGGDGNDFMDGGRGNDYLDGGNGDDIIVTGDGVDIVFGGAGGDSIYSTYTRTFGSQSTLHGGDGNDLIYGSYFADTLTGDGGDDLLWGGDDYDILLGGAGTDSILGGHGSDYFLGGAGSDYFNLTLDVALNDWDYLADFNSSEGDVVLLPYYAQNDVQYIQYGSYAVGYVAGAASAGNTPYQFVAANTTVADLKAHTYFV
jgi:Ca2+-binding RTX toxin-like protein